MSTREDNTSFDAAEENQLADTELEIVSGGNNIIGPPQQETDKKWPTGLAVPPTPSPAIPPRPDDC